MKETFDYIIVGSGAGGGPLAARLAEAGYRVLVLEAGSRHQEQPLTAPVNEVTFVPALHGVSTEHSDLSWQFFVEHYTKPPAGADPKRHAPVNGDPARTGIFYPRAAALGGCTIHNAMITIAGPDSDWDDLADFLGDDSWRGNRMRRYFERLEHNDYSPRPTATPKGLWGRFWENIRWLFGFDPDHTSGKHGFKGWLHTSVTDIALGLRDKQLVKMLKAALRQAKISGLERASTLVRTFLKGRVGQALDPNHAQTQAESPEGLALIPLAVCGKGTTVHQSGATPNVMRGRRSGPRELLLETQAKYPQNLTIEPDCFVTKVILDESNPPQARGVEFIRGKNLYRAHVQPNPEAGTPDNAFVRDWGDVILCGGAFNTPQLLMLSGIGDPAQLAEHDVACRVPSPGVGRNLQDRYEVTVVSEMKKEFSLLNGAKFKLPAVADQADPHLKEWREEGTGLYTSNGAVLGVLKRSRRDLNQPDLFIFGIPLPFKGYEIGYSDVGDKHNFFTWAILKSHTRNHDGTVQLRSSDPRDTPLINFHYFNELTRPDDIENDPDLLGLVDGVKFVRGIADHARLWIKGEDHPGTKDVAVTSDDQIKKWILRDAWGHHACGSCRMGPDGDRHAVLDTRFRVRGVAGLRVVDASIFPKIPGYFIVTNIYMAAEKAADVIIEDRRRHEVVAPAYPPALRDREITALAARRRKLTVEDDAGGNYAPVDDGGDWKPDVTGLALSGGGIRSATTNLGVLQALARGGALRRVDFLSTVSGGGYIGSFLGRIFDRLRLDLVVGRERKAVQSIPDRVESELTNHDSKMIAWLRRHGNYIAPAGPGDARLNLATFTRNFLSVHFVVGILMFAVFGIANALRYGVFDRISNASSLIISKGELPIGHLVESLLGPFFSPWFILAELILLFVVLPRMIGYWIVSQDRHETYQKPALLLLFLAAGVLFFTSLQQGLAIETLLISLALFSSFVHVENAWRRGRIREDAVGTGNAETQRLRTRNYLTYDLGLALALFGGAAAFALVDSLGRGLQQWLIADNHSYSAAFAGMGAALLALMPVVRAAANFLAGDQKSSGPPSTMIRIFKQQLIAFLLSALMLIVPLTFYAFASHAAYQGGAELVLGTAVTGLAILLSFVLTHTKALVFVNRSSLAQTYASRLARAYLGASNPLRHRPDGANITEVLAGDDVARIDDYRPHEAGGPLHLVNVTVNQTVDFTSLRGNRDRQGENVAVSPLTMSIGAKWHCAWTNSSESPGRQTKVNAQIEPIGLEACDEHPLVDEAGEPTSRAEMLSLRNWIAISGAAVGPGRGQTTSLGTALLFGLANLRTGYWWDSGISDNARDGFPKLNFMRRLLYLIPRTFSTQFLLLREWVAVYAGPWERFWNLSDGGFFENLAGYELIRRRVPRIIISDCGADPSYQFEDFANFKRKARIDYDAHFEPFTNTDFANHVPAELLSLVGSMDELKPPTDADGNLLGPSKKHAALFWVRYGGDTKRSVLLYLKAGMTGDESADVRNYHATHPEFPHEDTGDQCFEEAQWESYRRLGEHIASPLFTTSDWFWKIPL